MFKIKKQTNKILYLDDEITISVLGIGMNKIRLTFLIAIILIFLKIYKNIVYINYSEIIYGIILFFVLYFVILHNYISIILFKRVKLMIGHNLEIIADINAKDISSVKFCNSTIILTRDEVIFNNDKYSYFTGFIKQRLILDNQYSILLGDREYKFYFDITTNKNKIYIFPTKIRVYHKIKL